MTALDPLYALVAALSVDASGAIALAGRPIARARGTDEAALAEALMKAVYTHAYTRPYPPPPADAPAESLAPADLTAALVAANTTRAYGELGWTVFASAPGGGVVATRHGRTRRFAPGQYVALDGSAPPPPGAALAVQHAAGSTTLQPGFYYAFSHGFRDANDLSPIVRLYWNVHAAGAPAFVRTLTGVLNRYAIPFDLKVTTARADFARRDNAVLYLAQDAVAVAWLALSAAMPALRPTLEPGVPLFALEVAPGVGFAEDPGNGDSFGSARSALVAAALLGARRGEGFDPDAFAARFAEAVAVAGLDIDALWRNPGSKEDYPFTRSSLARIAA